MQQIKIHDTRKSRRKNRSCHHFFQSTFFPPRFVASTFCYFSIFSKKQNFSKVTICDNYCITTNENITYNDVFVFML